jgi:hypothetical protein
MPRLERRVAAAPATRAAEKFRLFIIMIWFPCAWRFFKGRKHGAETGIDNRCGEDHVGDGEMGIAAHANPHVDASTSLSRSIEAGKLA